jgi:hypothetical protein
MKLRSIIVGVSLLTLLGLSNNSFSQNSQEYSEPTNPNKMIPGAEAGKILNKWNDGFKAGLYFFNPKMQIGYVVEHDKKSNSSSLGKGIDLLKCGIEADYFPTNMEFIRPYIGSEIEFEHESYFVGQENLYYKKNGIGLEMKCGIEIKPFKDRKMGLFIDLGYNLSFDKKSEGYPLNPETKRDKFIAVIGLKF